MNAIAFDTASSSMSIALSFNGDLYEANLGYVRNHNLEILDNLQLLLSRSNSKLEDFAFIALGAGPGSFTALRIAFSTVKAVAYAKGIPVIGVPSLDSLYKNIEFERGLKAVFIDARKGSVYANIYLDDTKLDNMLDLSYQSAVDIILKYANQNNADLVTIVGDGYALHRDIFDDLFKSAGITVHPLADNLHIIFAKHTLAIATAMFTIANTDTPQLPLYVRRSEAEMRLNNS